MSFPCLESQGCYFHFSGCCLVILLGRLSAPVFSVLCYRPILLPTSHKVLDSVSLSVSVAIVCVRACVRVCVCVK